MDFQIVGDPDLLVGLRNALIFTAFGYFVVASIFKWWPFR